MSIAWLPLSHRKAISTPKVVFEPYKDQNYSGMYMYVTQQILVVEDPRLTIQEVASVIAHEFKHHLQHVNGEYNFHETTSYIRTDLDYETHINWYFNTFKHEREALLYEYKYTRTDYNHWWLKHLVTLNRRAVGKPGNPLVS